MRFKQALLVGTLLTAPILAQAQPVSGLYVGAGVGANMLQNETVKGLTLPNGTQVGRGTNPKFTVGPVGVGSVGYGFGNGLRVELEGNYRENDIRSVGGFGTVQRGRSEKYGAMVNALYDFDLTPYGISFVTPYLGVGAGYAHQDLTGTRSSNGGVTVTAHSGTGGDQFAYQGIAGVAYPLYSLVPGLSLTAEYRFYATPQDEKYYVQYSAPGVSGNGRVKVSDDLNHSVLIGLRYAFNTAAPPPPAAPVPAAAPAPAPSRTYLVFFDWDRSDLTDRARQIVADAAQNVGRVQYTRIEVDGHADRSGTPQYNQGLSLRRAQTVAGELVKDGVPQAAINIQAFGDTRPLVPTAAGVREPQNRRVEIIIR
jgi:outer membrane protein OmpA-like peptidoglycan-associated protein/outer membrane protein W